MTSAATSSDPVGSGGARLASASFRLALVVALMAGLVAGLRVGPTPGRLALGDASRSLAYAATWTAYRFSIVATSSGLVRAWARGVVANPGAVVSAGAENPGFHAFTFDAYFQPDAIYLRTGRTWYSVRYGHPAAVQLQDLQEPLRIWRRALDAALRAWRLPGGRVAVQPAWGSLGDYLTVDLRQVKEGRAVFAFGPHGELRTAVAQLMLDAPDAFTGSALWTITARFDPTGRVARPSLPPAARKALEVQ